jgi:DNA-binding NarL/FixJ family response regulator
MKIILADKQTLVRSGIRCLMQTIPGVKVVAETDDGQELLKLVARHRPDIVVTDIALAGISGLDCTEQIGRHYPATAVLILSDQTAMQSVRTALKAGVAGFLAKDAQPQELALALHATARGQSYFSPNVSRSALEQRRLPRGEDRPKLTVRQRQVMEFLAGGRTTKEIAGFMGVGIKTVETHRARAMETLRLKTANALIHYAIRHGFDGSNSHTPTTTHGT